MGILLKTINEEYVFFMKGADSVMIPLIRDNS